MKPTASAFIALAVLTVPSAQSFAYTPPCARGDIYVGGTTYEAADCVSRRDIKPLQALRMQKRNAVRTDLREQTRRTMLEQKKKALTERTIYLNPATSRRETRDSLLQNSLLRKYKVKSATLEINRRNILRGGRGASVTTSRQNRTPFSTWTKRSKSQQFNQMLDQMSETRQNQLKKLRDRQMNKVLAPQAIQNEESDAAIDGADSEVEIK